MSENTRHYIKQGSKYADRFANQVMPDRDHIHSMWGDKGSAEDMSVKRKVYIDARLAKFSKLMSQAGEEKNNRNFGKAETMEGEAWKEFGRALHPIMDSTSPVHNRVWRKRDGLSHGDNMHTRENLRAARKFKDKTVSKMRKVGM